MFQHFYMDVNLYHRKRTPWQSNDSDKNKVSPFDLHHPQLHHRGQSNTLWGKLILFIFFCIWTTWFLVALGFGYRAAIFRSFPEGMCFSSRGRKRFKDVEAAHNSVHVVKGQNMKLSPEFYRGMFEQLCSCTVLLERRVHNKGKGGIIIFCQCQ